MYKDYFGLWGGGIQGVEMPHAAMLRECMEELNFTPDSYIYLGQFLDYSCRTAKHIYICVMSELQLTHLSIHEGQYGQLFTFTGLTIERRISAFDRSLLHFILSIAPTINESQLGG
jgi:8-oxo-dGTP pyrophosphatase MutT (NUDIX family)